LPEGIPYVFISSVVGKGILELKDLLWKELNKETFHEVERIVHKNMDVNTLVFDEEDFIIPIEEDDLDDDEYEEYEDWDEEEND
jgi:GTP-binding protein